jgi:NADH dehydrogenase/NADH:ubiquinone oxidoreductase subunit G
MKPASLISSVQSEALTREIEQQLTEETAAIIASAERGAKTTVAQAHSSARRRMHEAVENLRREGARRLARARAQLDSAQRVRAQHQAAQAVSEALPLLRKALHARWRVEADRRQWACAVARLGASRLRSGTTWLVEHPADWSEAEQREFTAAIRKTDATDIKFKSDGDLAAGLRITADQALLDATPHGLLADSRSIAAMLLEEIGVRT